MHASLTEHELIAELRAATGPHVLVTTPYGCKGCSDAVYHVEVLPVDSTPTGLPVEMSRCECGGRYRRVGVQRFANL